MAKIKTQTSTSEAKSKSASESVETLADAQVSAVEAVSSEAPIPAPAIVVDAEALPAAPPIADHLQRKYRVKVRTTISYYGQMLVLPADSVVSAEGYGPEGLQRIIDSNVPLEKLE